MIITLNGQKKEINNGASLMQLIDSLSSGTKHIIAEVNGNIIKSPHWASTVIKENDSIELITFVGGG